MGRGEKRGEIKDRKDEKMKRREKERKSRGKWRRENEKERKMLGENFRFFKFHFIAIYILHK